MDTPSIGFRLTGRDIAPELLRAHDLAEILVAIETTLAETAVLEHRTIRKEQIRVSLVEIASGSASLRFSPEPVPLVMPAFELITSAIERSDYSQLPSGAIDGITTLLDHVRRLDAVMEIGLWNGQMNVKAQLTADTVILRPDDVVGPTIVYGQVMRIGGRVPRMMFLPIGSNSVIYGTVPQALARKLGARLYEIIGVSGVGRWDPVSLKLTGFNVETILDYEDIPIADAIDELAALCGEHIDRIDDPDAWLYELRYGGEEA